jgi:hypothetical protein
MIPERSGMVTGVGVVYLIIGALTVLAGVLIMVLGATLGAVIFGGGQAAGNAPVQVDTKGMNPEQAKAAQEMAKAVQDTAKAGGASAGGFLAGLGAILGVCVMAFGVIPLLGGIGVIQRKGWGRILTLIWAFVFLIFGLLGLGGMAMSGFNGQGLIQVLIQLGLGIWAIAVLFNSQYAAEFRPATA